MKKFFVIFFLILTSYFLLLKSVWGVNYPDPTGFVNDFANLYSSGFKSELENKLSEFEKSTGDEIAVVTVNNLEGGDIDDVAARLFEKWKIGKKNTDNGLLLLIFKEDRQMRIEVGYGLEPYVTDGRAGEIIRNDIMPSFKEGNYDEGTRRGVDRILQYISNKDTAVNSTSSKNSDFPIWPFLLIIYFVSTYLASFLGRTKEIWPGAAIGGVTGLISGLIFSTLFASIFIAIFAGLIGLFLDSVLSKNYKIRKDKGLPTGFWTSGGGFSSGGGGGSFGGFGGGSSGGGGASGRW